MREEYEKNAFDILKYIAAVFVMCKHYGRQALLAWRGLAPEAAAGYAAVVPVFRGIIRIVEFFEPVPVFFAVSGFLTAASRSRSRSAKEFAKKRIFRVFPALWLATAVYVIVLLVTERERLDVGMVPWLLTQIVGFANTPSCLRSYATGSVNGALWMIFVLLQMYALMAVLYPRMERWGSRAWAAAIALCAAGNVLSGWLEQRLGAGTAGARMLERTFIPYLLWYLVGALCYVRRERTVPAFRKHGWKLFAAAAAAAIAGHGMSTWADSAAVSGAAGAAAKGIARGYYCGLLEGLAAAAAGMILAFRLPAHRIRHDFTYELFLYHWMVLNLFAALRLMWRNSPLAAFAAFLISAAAVSAAMYFLRTGCLDACGRGKR